MQICSMKSEIRRLAGSSNLADKGAIRRHPVIPRGTPILNSPGFLRNRIGRRFYDGRNRSSHLTTVCATPFCHVRWACLAERKIPEDTDNLCIYIRRWPNAIGEKFNLLVKAVTSRGCPFGSSPRDPFLETNRAAAVVKNEF